MRQHIFGFGPVLMCLVVLAGVAPAGCERDEPDPVVTTPPVTPPVAPATAPAADAGGADAKAGEAGVTVDEATRVKFNTLIEQVTRHIRNREFDAADTGLREIEQMRATLSEPMKQQITTTRAALTAARAAPAAPPAK